MTGLSIRNRDKLEGILSEWEAAIEQLERPEKLQNLQQAREEFADSAVHVAKRLIEFDKETRGIPQVVEEWMQDTATMAEIVEKSKGKEMLFALSMDIITIFRDLHATTMPESHEQAEKVSRFLHRHEFG